MTTDTDRAADLSRHLKPGEVQRLASISRTTLNRWEAAGRFPRRVARSPRNVAWRLDEVRAWLELGPEAWAKRHRALGNTSLSDLTPEVCE